MRLIFVDKLEQVLLRDHSHELSVADDLFVINRDTRENILSKIVIYSRKKTNAQNLRSEQLRI